MRVRIYMKSGSVITLRGVKDVLITPHPTTGNIGAIDIKRHWYMKYLSAERLHGAALDNSQIEAITYK